MAAAHFTGASPNAHLLIGQMPAPSQLYGRCWEGTGLSIAGHAVVLGVLAYAATHVPQVMRTADDVSGRFKVFLDRPEPGGGGGGGGEKTTDPPRPAEIIRTKPLEITPVAGPADTPPIPELNIPVVTVQAERMLPGAATQMNTTSPGPGSGPGGGGGRGAGSGPGEDAGLGAGGQGGYGGDAMNVGNGVTRPVLIKEVKPAYTGQAMRAKIQGIVEMDAVVMPDGSVDLGSIRVTRSLDSMFGLDQQAIIAVKQWRFQPGTFKGQPVAVRVGVELLFTLR